MKTDTTEPTGNGTYAVNHGNSLKGYADGEGNVEPTGTLTFTDDGSGNITITEGN